MKKIKSLFTEPASRTAFFLLLLALLARIVCVLVQQDGVGDPDSAEYLALAQSIRFHGVFSFGGPHSWGSSPPLNGHGPFLPTAARAPLYPLLIAALWWNVAPPIFSVQIVQVGLGATVCVLTYWIALSLTNYRTALFAGLITALAPLSSFMTAAIMSETLFTFLLILGIWFWSRKRGFLAGLIFGAAALTRPIVLPFVILIALSAAILKFNRGIHARIALGAFLIIVPWTVRNLATQNALVPIQTQGWAANLLLGTVDIPYGANSNQWVNFQADPAFRSIVSSSKTETDAERRMLGAALNKIRKDPSRWLWTRMKEFPRLFADSGMYFVPFIPLSPRFIKFIMLGFSFLFLGLAGIGMIAMRKNWRQFYFLGAFPIFMCCIQFPVYGEPRFMVPAFPLLAIFASIPLADFSWGQKLHHGLAPSDAG